MIITLRTDNPVAEVGVFDATGQQLSYHTWQADRQLAKDLPGVVQQQLAKNGADFTALTGVVVFKGPGSFTGLRIGITTANTIAYAQNIPIVGELGEAWLATGLRRLMSEQTDKLVLPHYGAEPNISTPKK